MNRLIRLFMLVSTVFTFSISCNRNPYRVTDKFYKKQARMFAHIIRQAPLRDSLDSIDWVGTTNFNLRKPNFVIIHHTAQNSCDQTLKTFTLPQSQVSAHYVICKDGTIHHMLNDYLRAWHGGIAKWGNNTDINSSSIGIEIDNDGFEPFTDQQIASLLKLLHNLRKAYGIPVQNFIGHADIAPTRKNDPNVHFPWKTLADSGYGVWWSDTTGIQVPESFNSMEALRIIGYDIKDSAAAVQSFKRHFEQQDKSSALDDADRKVLFTLYRKFE